MNRSTLGIILALLAVLIIGGFVIASNRDEEPATTTQTQTQTESTGTDESQSTKTQTAETSTVEIKDSAYVPAKIQVKKGTKVTWTNMDNIQHDVTPDDESDAFQGSELLSKGESYSVTFNTVGTYTYHCTPHPFMKGTVEVVE